MASNKLHFWDKFRRTKVYHSSTYNPLPKWLNWEQIEAKPAREGIGVVKGTSKRVVVVKSPDSRVFEQAIFIVREDYLNHGSHANALKEAQEVADQYIKSAVASPRRFIAKIPPLIYGIIGVLIAAVVTFVLF